MELALACTRRQIGVSSGKSAGLEVFIGVVVKRDRLPIAAFNGPQRHMVSDLAGIAEHGIADIIGGVGVIVGAQVFGVTKSDADVLAAQFEARIGHAVTEFSVEHGEARRAEEVAKIVMGTAWRGIWRVIGADAASKARKECRRKVKPAGCGNGVRELLEAA